MTYIILSSWLGNVISSVTKAMAPVTVKPKRPMYRLSIHVFSLGSLYFCVRVAPAENTPATPTKMYLSHVMKEITGRLGNKGNGNKTSSVYCKENEWNYKSDSSIHNIDNVVVLNSEMQ